MAPLQVSLEGDASEGAGLDYSWTVSQNQVSTASAFDYTFSEPGLHRVVLTVEDEQGQTDSETLFVSVLPPLPSVSTYGEGVDELAVELDSLNSAILRMIEAATDGYSSSEISIDESNAGRVFAAIQHAQAYNARFLLIESQVDSLAEASGSAGAQSAMLSTANAPSDDEGIGFKVLNEMTSGVAKFFSSAFSLQSGRVEDFAPMVLETLRNPSAYPDSYEALGDRPDPVTSVADWQALSTNEKRWKVERLRGTLFCVEWQSACRENDQKFAEDLGKTAVEGGKMSVELGTSAAGLDDPELDVVKEVTRAQGSNVPETVIEVAYETAQASFGTVKQNVTETVDKLFERTQPDSDSPTVDASNAKQYLRRFVRQANQVEHNTLGQVIDVQLNDALDRFPELGFRDADGSVVMHVPEKSHIGESTRSGTYKTFADKVQIGAVTDQVVAYFNEVRNPDTDASYPLNPSAADAAADVQTGATVSTNSYSSEPTYVRGEISTSTWSKYGSPYVIEDEVTVSDDATLTVDPGAVVKFDREGDVGGDLQVRGTLQAEGTEQDSVVFTSIRDDSYGGDTNGDGDSTSASPGDWGGISFMEESEGVLDHAVLKYGASAVYIVGASPTITNSRVAETSLRGVQVREGSPAVTGNRIAENEGKGISVDEMSDRGAATPLVEENVIAGNSGAGLSVQQGGATVRDNVFTGNAEAAVRIALQKNQTSPAPTLRRNVIENNNVGVSISGSPSPNLGDSSGYGLNIIRNNAAFGIEHTTSDTIQAVGNYWDATSASEIDDKIYDDDEDGSSGPVIFDPFLEEPPTEAVEVASEETGEITLGETGAIVSITENDDSDGGELQFRRQDTRPLNNAFEGSATAPDGSTVSPDKVAQRYWRIDAEDLTDVTFSVRLDAAGIGGVGLPGQQVILKRSGTDSTWTPLETTREGDTLTASGLTSFSQFTIGGDPAAAAPSEAPALVAPSPEASGIPDTPILSWESVGQARQYRIELSTAAGFPEGEIDAYTTPNTEHTPPPLQRETTYYWRVRGENSKGSGTWSATRQFTTRVPNITFEVSQSFDGASGPSDYRLVALPGQVERPLGEAVSGDAGSEWQAFWDDGSAEDYLTEYDGSETFAFRPGRGFWLTSRQEWTLTDSVKAVPLGEDQSTAIPLHEGWNIISNPMRENVSWSAVETANSDSLQPVWAFEGSFQQADTLRSATAGQAYYFLNDQGLGSLTVPYPTASKSEPKEALATDRQGQKSTGPGEAVSMTLVATAEDSLRSEATIGIGQGAAEGLESRDVVAPPSRFSALSLRLEPRGEPPDRRGRLAAEWRPPATSTEGNEDGHTFSLQLRAKASGPAEVKATGLEAFQDQEVALLRSSTGQSWDLREKEAVTLRNADSTALKLAVGSAAYVEDQEQDVVPNEVTLTSYPNPLQKQGTIEYTLPEATDVRITVYDVLGRRVAVLEDSHQEAGRHTARLDGGRLASGVYFGRLETDGQTRTQKITVVR